MWIEILLLLVLLCGLTYWYVTKNFGYFRRMGVAEDPASFPYGSECMRQVWSGRKCVMKSYEDADGKFANERFWGIYCFGQRHLVVKVKIFEQKEKYLNKRQSKNI